MPAAGSELTVWVNVRGKLAADVASFTTKLQNDTTGLRYVGEAAMADSATRITNPIPGLIRSAGIAPNGFGDGRLAGYRFTVVRPDAVRRMQLIVDEIHTNGRVTALTSLVVTRALVLKDR